MISDKLTKYLKDSFDLDFYMAHYLFACKYNITGILEYSQYHHFFGEWFNDELKHMRKVAKKMHGYLIEVEIPKMDIPCHTDIEEILNHLYQMELNCIEHYSKAFKLSEELGDFAMAEFFIEILKCHELYRERIIKRLGAIPKGE